MLVSVELGCFFNVKENYILLRLLGKNEIF